jgi:hypothetical protein
MYISKNMNTSPVLPSACCMLNPYPPSAIIPYAAVTMKNKTHPAPP